MQISTYWTVFEVPWPAARPRLSPRTHPPMQVQLKTKPERPFFYRRPCAGLAGGQGARWSVSENYIGNANDDMMSVNYLRWKKTTLESHTHTFFLLCSFILLVQYFCFLSWHMCDKKRFPLFCRGQTQFRSLLRELQHQKKSRYRVNHFLYIQLMWNFWKTAELYVLPVMILNVYKKHIQRKYT